MKTKILCFLLILLTPLTACSQKNASGLPSSPASALILSSASFENGQPIPDLFTCSGDDRSPTLKWGGIPAGTKSLALIADDPDAPGGTWVHWVLYNIPPGITELPEGIQKDVQIAGTGTQGITSFNQPGYGGPCPPKGKVHHYTFKLFALDLGPDLPAGLNSTKLHQMMKDHVLAQGEWMGTYQR